MWTMKIAKYWNSIAWIIFSSKIDYLSELKNAIHTRAFYIQKWEFLKAPHDGFFCEHSNVNEQTKNQVKNPGSRFLIFVHLMKIDAIKCNDLNKIEKRRIEGMFANDFFGRKTYKQAAKVASRTQEFQHHTKKSK